MSESPPRALPTFDCPICSRELTKPGKVKTLNGFGVCRRCRNGFANRRQLAYIIDYVAWTILASLGVYAYAMLRLQAAVPSGGGAFLSWPIMERAVNWLLLPLVFSLKDGFSGMSLGKWMTGVQVVDVHSREPIGFRQSFKRNLVLLVPFSILIVALTMMKGRRWGDAWADTVVVWRKFGYKRPFDPRGFMCTGCGYNLTGNMSGRCPECFTPVPSGRRVPEATEASAS